MDTVTPTTVHTATVDDEARPLMWTFQKGKGSTVVKVIDGSLNANKITGIAGVSNIGNDLNWTGHPFAQVNWYGFGRLAWNPYLDSLAKH